MKAKWFPIIFLTLSANYCFGQLKVNGDGNVIIGPDTTWSNFNLNITGSGASGSEGMLSFGDNSSSSRNVLLGEYGSGDTDQLLLHGDNGINFSTTESTSTKVFLSEGGNLGIGTTNPSSTLSVGDAGSVSYKVNILGSTGSNYRAIQATQPTSSSDSHTNYGIVGSLASGSGGYKLFGVYGTAYRGSTATNARSYGVYGYAGNGISGYNFGVYGYLAGSRNGTAVYGSTSGDPWTAIDDQYAGYFKGDVHITGDLTVDGTYPTSDINLKKDIRPIEEDVITKLAQLQAIRFKLKHPSELKEIGDTLDLDQMASELQSEKYTKDRIGLIAQELRTTFPEVVKEGNDGYLRVNYDQLIPVLVKAINLQQQHIVNLEASINALSQNNGIQSLTTNSSSPDSESDNKAKIYQNKPNPFNEITQINYFLPSTFSNALLNIYDLQGGQVLSYEISTPGEGYIEIQASQLNPGVYIYTLITANGKTDSKQMIITE